MPEAVKYVVLTGLNYPPGRRAEPTDVVDDIPGESVKWLLADGHIRKATAKDLKGTE